MSAFIKYKIKFIKIIFDKICLKQLLKMEDYVIK